MEGKGLAKITRFPFTHAGPKNGIPCRWSQWKWREEEGELARGVPLLFQGHAQVAQARAAVQDDQTGHRRCGPRGRACCRPWCRKWTAGSPARNRSRERALSRSAGLIRSTTAAILLRTWSGLKGVGREPRTPQNVTFMLRALPSAELPPSRAARQEAFLATLLEPASRSPALECSGPVPDAGALLRRDSPTPRGRRRTRSRKESCGTAADAPRTRSIRRSPRICNRGSAFSLRLIRRASPRATRRQYVAQELLPVHAQGRGEGVEVRRRKKDIARGVAAAAASTACIRIGDRLVEHLILPLVTLSASHGRARTGKEKAFFRAGKKAPGERRIRTFEGVANRFTVCPL